MTVCNSSYDFCISLISLRLGVLSSTPSALGQGVLLERITHNLSRRPLCAWSRPWGGQVAWMGESGPSSPIMPCLLLIVTQVTHGYLTSLTLQPLDHSIYLRLISSMGP